MKRIAIACILLAGSVFISACGTTSSTVTDQVVRGIPEGWEGPGLDLLAAESAIGWINGEESFGITTFSSRSCPPIADSVVVVPPSSITVEFQESVQNPCTADSSVTTHVFAFPSELVERPITVLAIFPDEIKTFLLP